jgi:hypothetical protein
MVYKIIKYAVPTCHMVNPRAPPPSPARRAMSGARALQTLSRLNRPAPALGKQPCHVLVVDFVNSVGVIREAFEEFFTATTLTTGGGPPAAAAAAAASLLTLCHCAASLLTLCHCAVEAALECSSVPAAAPAAAPALVCVPLHQLAVAA